jgi:hypothetical protein
LDVGNISSFDSYFSQIPLTNMIYLYIITPYIRMLDSDWLIAVIFILSGPNVIYLFNSTEWCYIKRTTVNV